MRSKKSLLIVCLIFGILLFLILSLNFSTASFQLAQGNGSYSVNLIYGPSGAIKGWLNISLQNEPIDSLISNNLNGSIKLTDFLDAALAEYNCVPADCGEDYNLTNGQDSKSFSLGYGEEKILSFFIQEGTISSIKEMKFDVSASNNPSCLSPLKIDILNDGLIEWSSRNFLSDYSCMYEQGRGCFDASATLSNVRIDDTPFCGKINLIEGGNFSLGAWVKKGTTAWYNGLLQMYLYDLDGFYLASCNLPEPSTAGGEISCTLEYDNDRIQEYYVCIKADQGKSTDYEIKKEDVEPCGFYAYPGEETEYHDYYIFAKAAKFANIGQFLFDQDEYEDQGNFDKTLNQYVLDYLDKRYNRQCLNGCSIPIKFESYGNLNIVVSNATLDYSTGAGPQLPLHLIYDTGRENAKINSEFQKLNLEKTGFSAPSGVGRYTLRLKLNDEQILEEYIEVIAAPVIQDIIPKDVPALVKVKFMAVLNGTGNLTYMWDFGDGSEKTTNTNKVEHTYSSLGIYQLSVVVKNEYGNASKTVQINAGSPKEYINKTIQDYNSKLDEIQSEINKLPEWIKNQIDGKINLEGLKGEIKFQEDKYVEAFSDEDYIEIMSNLLELEIPDSFGVSQVFSSSQILPAQEQINLGALEYLGAGDIEAGAENYACAVTDWINDNLDITLESKTYSLYYDSEEEALYSYIKVILQPKQDLGEVYFLVNGNSADIKFKEDYGIKKYTGKSSSGIFNKILGNLISRAIYNGVKEGADTLAEASGIVFSELKEPKTIEFLYPEKIEIGDFPIYISPAFENLELEVEPGICNFNKRCEKDLGENYKNCRSDCKPLGWTLFWLFILFFGAFVIYIILQEWYKRFYESRLFKNKNQLFNLINFMHTSFNQGIGRSKIFSNLKDLDWSGEQLNYAWRKLHGKRTGMWEIPLFKWVEKKEVKRELEKRAGVQTFPGMPEAGGGYPRKSGG